MFVKCFQDSVVNTCGSCVACMERSLSFTWPTRSAANAKGYIDAYDDLRTVRKQIKLLRKQDRALRKYKRDDEYWKLAQEHGCGTGATPRVWAPMVLQPNKLIRLNMCVFPESRKRAELLGGL